MESGSEMTVGEALAGGLLRVNPAFRWSAGKSLSDRIGLDMSYDAKRIAAVIGLWPCAHLLKIQRARSAWGWLSIPTTLKAGHWLRESLGNDRAIYWCRSWEVRSWTCAVATFTPLLSAMTGSDGIATWASRPTM